MTIQRMATTTVAVVAAAAIGLTGCTATPEPEGDLTLTLAVDDLIIEGWDILQGADVQKAGTVDAQAVFDTLMYWDDLSASGEPRLARELEIADDRRSMVLRLEEDVDFVDGTHFDAAGLATYLTALMDSAYVAVGALSAYEPVYEATGEYELTITTGKPIYAGDFLPTLFGLLIQSPAVLDDPEQAALEPNGSGPYVIDDTIPGVERTYVRNADYWDPERYPYDRIVLKMLPDPVAKLNALKSGQVDVANVDPLSAAEAEAAGLIVHEALTDPVTLIVQNPVESPSEPLRDVRVRQAIAYAFDREAIVDAILQGYGVATSQPFTEGQAEWVEGGDDRYGYDPERARELMAEAGYAEGFDLTLPGNALITAPYEPIVQQSLGDIGIRVTWETIPDITEWTKAELGGQYPLYMTNPGFGAMIRIITEEFPGFGRFIVPTQEVLAWVEDIKGGDTETSAEASKELGEFMLEEAWIIPLVASLSLWATDPSVDIDMDTSDSINALLGPGLHKYSPAD